MAATIGDRAPIGRVVHLARIGLLDLIGPLVVYALCRHAGMPTVWALVTSGATPGVGVAADWLRWRALEVVGTIVLVGIALSVVLALVSDDTSVVLLEGAILTVGFGLACLASLPRRRPLMFYFAQTYYGGRHSSPGAELDVEFESRREARAFWRIVTVVWALAYVVEGLARVVVIQSVPVAAALAVNRIAPWVVSAVLFGWTLWWGSRLRGQVAGVAESPHQADYVPLP
ncbi:MAG TPA: VC0807 family protein [Marmoricola sp.]|nr:VC0807 family protein [Marmoricola sp.]